MSRSRIATRADFDRLNTSCADRIQGGLQGQLLEEDGKDTELHMFTLRALGRPCQYLKTGNPTPHCTRKLAQELMSEPD